jgi:hypothetical protein
MATLDQINQGIVAAAQKGDVESARTLKAARDNLMASGGSDSKPKQSWLQKHGRELAMGAGGTLGAVIAAPLAFAEAIPTLGVGSVATEMGAAGLGAGMGGQAYDAIQQMMGRKNTMTAGQRFAQALGDVTGGAMAIPAGKLIGAGTGVAAKAVAPYVRPTLNAAERAIAPVVQPAFNATKKALEPISVPTGKVIARVLSAGPEAQTAVGGVRQQALAKALEEAGMAKRTETMATTKAKRALTAQQSADAAAGNVSPIGVGKVTYLSERGRPAQEAVQAAEAAADQQRVQAFQNSTAAIDDAVKANEQKGLFINDTPEAKKLLKETSDILSPKPGSAPTTAPMPTSGQARAHKMIQDALQNRTVPLTAAEAKEAQGLGYKVDVIKGGGTDANPIPDTYSRTFKTPLEAVTNLRRYFGDAAYGKTDISGFEGINASTFRDLNSKLKGVEDAYTAGLGAEQRAAYKTALENLDKFRTGVGKKLTATEGMTESNKMAASNAPKAIIGGGADTYAQFKAMNPVAADKFAKDSIETALNNPVTGKPLNYDAAAAKVGPNTQLGDIINDVPELKVRVQQHLNQLLDAKNAGIDAKSFKVDYKAASAAEKSAIDSRINYQSKFIELKNASDKEILTKSESLFKQLVTDKKITPNQYDKYLEEIKQASKKVGYKEARNRALIAASTAIGGLGLVKGVRTVQGVLGE